MATGVGQSAQPDGACCRKAKPSAYKSLARVLMTATAICWLPGTVYGQSLGSSPQHILNFYGEGGLLDMPSARFEPDGEFSLTVAAMPVGERYSLGFQALPWLETEFRYSRIDRMTIHRDDYDRSLGLKVRLSQEDDFWPSIAVGAQDVLGTGAFGAEYFAASKHVGNLDFTLGLGWRRFSGLASFENPLSIISNSFLKVPSRGKGGGRPLISQFFHGPDVGLFGGVTWDTPIDNLTLIAELSGDNYTQQQLTGAIDVKIPVNLGFSYQPADDIQISGGWMYGTQWGIRVSVLLNGNTPPPTPRIGVQPLPPHIRDPEARNTAVLGMLQDATDFYEKAPFMKLPATSEQQEANALYKGSFADALFESATYRKVNVEGIESFGQEMILNISGRRATCGDFADAMYAAADAGFKDIVINSDSGKVTICRTNSAGNTALLRTASLTVDNGVGNNAPVAEAPTASTDDQPETLQAKLKKALEDQKIVVVALKIETRKIEVAFTNLTYQSETEAIGRVLRVLMATAPDDVESFRVVSVTDSVASTGITFSRSDLERTLNLFGAASELLTTTSIQSVDDRDPLLTENNLIDYPAFDYWIGPGYRQSLFDPDQPYRFEIYGTVAGDVSLTRNWGVYGSLEFNIYNTFDIARRSNSVLPHVRSDFSQYYKEGLNGIASLMTNYIGKLSPEVYFQARAGYLESMFAGAGGEVFWQPPQSRFSFGGALYAVQQRNFDRLFGLRNYKVVTGHVSAYYDSPFYDLDFEVDAGRYLAGDYGATFQITRRFANGMEIGAYATFTNVPFSKFGEGSFDKGIIIHIPLGDLAPINTQDEMRLDFSPLTRDGGQRLDGEETLHEALQRSSEGDMLPNWQEVLRP